MLSNEWIFIPEKTVIYQVRHRIMEGDCQVEHGPVAVHIPAFSILRYPVTNGQYMAFVRQTGYTSRSRPGSRSRAGIRGNSRIWP